MENKKIKNIIFDLGGVIIDLDTSKTIEAFARLSGKGVEEIIKIADSIIFKQYERGEIESKEFREELRKLFLTNFDDGTIDNAWNAMIGDTPAHRLEWLSSLNKKYRVFILSNTNHIHVNFFHNYLKEHHGINNFSQHVEDVYYSQLIGMRKPDREIYNLVLSENDLEPEHTLFLDDNIHNLEGAKEIGIHTLQVEHPESVPQLLLAYAGIEI